MTSTAPRPASLRLWPGIVLLALQWGTRFGWPVLAPDMTPFAMLGAVAFGLLIFVWWLFLSRAPRGERFGGIALVIASLVGTHFLLHESLATAGWASCSSFT